MISAQEQVQFLHRLTSGQLPLGPAVVQAVKEIALAEKTDRYSLYAKTGWYWPDDGGQQIGWWVGWVERDGEQYPFALNIDIKTEADAAKRLPIARDCLHALGKL
jgi:beta-lactamase class D